MDINMDIPLEIWENIFIFLDFLSKIRITQISKFLNRNLYIIDFYNLPFKYLILLADIMIRPYAKIKYLNIEKNWNLLDIQKLDLIKLKICNNIRQIDNFKNLQILYLSNNKHIFSIKNPKLRKLYSTNTDNLWCISCNNLVELSLVSSNCISDLNNLTNLKKLTIVYCSGITNTSIKNLKLTELFLGAGTGISDLNNITSLKKLNTQGLPNFSITSIQNLNLLELNIAGNQKITDLNIFTSLKKLEAPDNIILTNTSIQKLNLTELNINNSPYITDINFLTNLKILSCQNNSGISKTSIQKLNLTELDMRNNKNIITDINFFRKGIKILDPNGIPR